MFKDRFEISHSSFNIQNAFKIIFAEDEDLCCMCIDNLHKDNVRCGKKKCEKKLVLGKLY